MALGYRKVRVRQPTRKTSREQSKEIARRKCIALQAPINDLVYELYGLSDAEMAAVEKNTAT
jgi:hypothetical protein